MTKAEARTYAMLQACLPQDVISESWGALALVGSGDLVPTIRKVDV